MTRLFSAFLLLLLFGSQMLAQPPANHAYSEKLILHTDRNLYLTTETIWMSITCLSPNEQLPGMSQVAYIQLVDRNGTVFSEERISLENGQGIGNLFLQPEIPSGFYAIRTYTLWQAENSPNEIIYNTIRVLNPSAPPTPQGSTSTAEVIRENPISTTDFYTIELDANSFGPREKVELSINGLLQISQEDVFTNSLAVYKVPKQQPKASKIDKETFMLPGQELIERSYLGEWKAPLISGTIDAKSHIPEYITLVFPGRSSILLSAPVDSMGTFRAEIPKRIANNTFYLYNSTDSIAIETEIKNHFLETPTQVPLPTKWPFQPGDSTFLESLNRNIQLSQVYKNNTFINGIHRKLTEHPSHFYGIPNRRYNLDDYTRFEKMNDLFIEYISGVNLRTRNQKRGFFVDSDSRLPSTAFLLIDGIPIQDVDEVLAFDPLITESIDIVDKMYVMGNQRLSGILSFTTYKGVFGNQPIPNYLTEKKYFPLQQLTEFYAPDYNKPSELLQNIPDYRTTLLWIPHLAIKSSTNPIIFYTGDDSGRYKVVIRTVLTSGQEVYSEQFFNVEN